MIKKKYNDEIFTKLDWVLKKKGKAPNFNNKISYFLFNRWLSMSDPSVAQIVNATTNRWNTQKGEIGNESFFLVFFKNILPKINKKFIYIKKPLNEEEEKTEQSLENLQNLLEISKRELNFYEKTIAEMNIGVK
jgi:hypothetical protein